MSKFTDIALPLAARGLLVMPVRAGGKEALLKGWQLLATGDPTQIERWGFEWPDANVGVVAKPDNVVVLDCDVKGMIRRIQDETGRELPDTLCVRSGKGMAHIYFWQTDESRRLGNRNAALSGGGEFFSLRSVNRYVVGPDSVHPNGRKYEIKLDAKIADFPEWLAPWVERYSTPEKPRDSAGDRAVSEDFDFDEFVAHYGIECHGNGPWYVTPECPYAGRAHEQSRQTGFYYDGTAFGFHCFAAGCGDPSIGAVIRKLNETHDPYPGVIWEREPIGETLEAFGAPAKEEAKPEPPAAKGPARLAAMPESCMYGWLGEFARTLNCPLGYAYPAAIAAFAGQGVPHANRGRIRANIYCALIATLSYYGLSHDAGGNKHEMRRPRYRDASSSNGSITSYRRSVAVMSCQQ